MNKKVLAILLAVCMIASGCALFASAASYSVGAYVQKVNTSGTLTNDNIKAATKGTDFDANVTVTPKTSISMNTGATVVNADNVDTLFTFKSGTKTLTYSANLINYFDVSGTISGNTATATFSDKTANNVKVYLVTEAIATTDTDVSGKVSEEAHSKYVMDGGDTYSATISKWVTKLSALTMGVRFYGTEYKNLVAAEIAKVTATVNRQSGAVTNVTTSVSNTISDLLPGDTVTLTTSLKNDADVDFYAFNCWVDSSGNVISTDKTITYTADGNSASIYAAYVELKNRFVVDYSSEGKGKVVYEEAREVFDGDAQISVMEGKDATFTFVPDEGYEVSKVLIDGKNVISFLSLVDSTNLLKSLKILINASNKETYKYTFEKVSADHTIEVVFAPIENFEAPSGLELPTVEAEGIELATGAADAEGGKDGATTVPAENGAAANGSAVGGVVNPATGSGSAIAVFAVMTVAAGAAFVTMKKKED
jgi:hypothetical protein